MDPSHLKEGDVVVLGGPNASPQFAAVGQRDGDSIRLFSFATLEWNTHDTSSVQLTLPPPSAILLQPLTSAKPTRLDSQMLEDLYEGHISARVAAAALSVEDVVYGRRPGQTGQGDRWFPCVVVEKTEKEVDVQILGPPGSVEWVLGVTQAFPRKADLDLSTHSGQLPVPNNPHHILPFPPSLLAIGPRWPAMDQSGEDREVAFLESWKRMLLWFHLGQLDEVDEKPVPTDRPLEVELPPPAPVEEPQTDFPSSVGQPPRSPTASTPLDSNIYDQLVRDKRQIASERDLLASQLSEARKERDIAREERDEARVEVAVLRKRVEGLERESKL